MKDYISNCSVCLTFQHEECRELLEPHDFPSRLWAKVAADLLTWNEHNYLITTDYFSSFFEVELLADTLSRMGIEKLSVHFAKHGIPDIFISDNGPQFINETFKCFMKKWNICHVTSSPHYPLSNGKVENAVKTCKMLMKKAKKNKEWYLFSITRLQKHSLRNHRHFPSSEFIWEEHTNSTTNCHYTTTTRIY